jgi:hypothetical protein
MQEADRSTGRQFLACFAAFAIAALTGCSGTQLNEMHGGGLKFISMPKIEEEPALKIARTHRIKVSAIEIRAQRDDTRLWSATLRRRGIVSGPTLSSEFRIKGEFSKTVRRALDYVFEADPASDKVLKVTAKITLWSQPAQNRWCNYWDTRTSVTLDITVESRTGGKAAKSHFADEDEIFCIELISFPDEGAINDNVQKAFQRVIVDVARKWADHGT